MFGASEDLEMLQAEIDDLKEQLALERARSASFQLQTIEAQNALGAMTVDRDLRLQEIERLKLKYAGR